MQNRDGNLNVPYLIENGGEVVVNWNCSTTTGTTTTLRLASQLASLLTPLLGGVEFCELSVPATEHLADFFYFHRKCGILFVVQ